MRLFREHESSLIEPHTYGWTTDYHSLRKKHFLFQAHFCTRAILLGQASPKFGEVGEVEAPSDMPVWTYHRTLLLAELARILLCRKANVNTDIGSWQLLSFGFRNKHVCTP
jgi:hypothetical protein